MITLQCYVSAVHQHESAIGIHISLPLKPLSTYHTIPPYRMSQSTRLSSLHHTAKFRWLFIFCVVMHMFQCYALSLSHPLLPPLSPRGSSLCLCLLCYTEHRVINTIFLDSIYICVNMQYLFFSFWLTSLCIIGSRFIHLIRTDSNVFLFIGE